MKKRSIAAEQRKIEIDQNLVKEQEQLLVKLNEEIEKRQQERNQMLRDAIDASHQNMQREQQQQQQQQQMIDQPKNMEEMLPHLNGLVMDTSEVMLLLRSNHINCKFLVLRMMEERRQKPDEKARAYIIALQEIANDGGVSDEDLIACCVKGLRCAQFNRSAFITVRTVDDLKHAATELEEIARPEYNHQ